MSQEKLQTMIMQFFWGGKEVYYGICASREILRKTRAGKSRDCHDVIVFFTTISRRFQIPPVWTFESVFEKLRFGDGFRVWTVDLIVDIKLNF